MPIFPVQHYLPTCQILALPKRVYWRPSSKTLSHSHPFYELGVVMVGACDWILDEKKTLSLKIGDGIFLSPGQTHYEIPHDGVPTKVGWIGFSFSKGDAIPLPSSKWLNRKLSLGVYFVEIQNLMDRVQREIVDPSEDSDLRIGLALVDLLLLLRRASKGGAAAVHVHPKKETERHANALDSAAQYLEQNCANTLRITQIARYYSLSSSHFTSLFRSRFRCSPKSFLLRKRLEKAQRLLREGNRPVKEIAAECGFLDAAHFCKSFKNDTGQSPLAFARSL